MKAREKADRASGSSTKYVAEVYSVELRFVNGYSGSMFGTRRLERLGNKAEGLRGHSVGKTLKISTR